jgi:ketosteroid isomerase-like protein
MTKAGHTAIQRWHELVASRNFNGLDQLPADDVVFQSPAVHTPQVGKVITKKYPVAAMHVLDTGQITKFKVMLRPIKALQTVVPLMAQALQGGAPG